MSNLSFYTNTILVDSIHKNNTFYFYDDREKSEFLSNKNKNKLDQRYLEKDIIYKFNSLGYRTDELTNAKDNDFILVFGCSHSEGIGLFEEDIWCSQLSSSLGIKKINLGKASSGPDIQFINTMQYIKNKYPKPKLVIYQWPQVHRRSFTYVPRAADPATDDETLIVKHQTVFTKTEKLDTGWYFRRFCVESGEMLMGSYSHYTASNLLWNGLGVPVFNWTWGGDFTNTELVEDLLVVDTIDTGRARDLMHDGPDIHSQVVDQILPKVDKLL